MRTAKRLPYGRFTTKIPAGRRLRRVLALLAALFVATALTQAIPSAARADTEDGICDTGEFCVWKDINFQGPRTDMIGEEDDYAVDPGQYVDGCCLNDTVTATTNYITSYYVRLYEHREQGGLYLTHHKKNMCPLPLCHSYSYVGFMNDIASSHETRVTP